MKHVLSTFLSVLFIILAAVPAPARLGEWESSGTPTPPYYPQGSLEYSCRIVVYSSIRGQNFPAQNFSARSEVVFHTADFKNLGHVTYTTTGQEAWEFNPNDQIQRPMDFKALLTDHQFYLSFSPNGSMTSELDTVHLGVSLNVNYRKLKISTSARNSAPRKNRLIESTADVSFKSGSNYESLEVGVSCINLEADKP